MHRNHKMFVEGIHRMMKVTIILYEKEAHRQVSRTCAPLDFGPSRRAKDKCDRYHFWDYEGGARNHVLSVLPDQIVRIQETNEEFDPSEFITWDVRKSPWFMPRQWGRYS